MSPPWLAVPVDAAAGSTGIGATDSSDSDIPPKNTSKSSATPASGPLKAARKRTAAVPAMSVCVAERRPKSPRVENQDGVFPPDGVPPDVMP